MTYDKNNVFAKILRGELPCTKIYEDKYAVAFPDLYPQAPTHVLVIPKGAYVSWADFSAKASAGEIAGFVKAVGKVAKKLGVEENGYRLLANVGADAGQIVPHLHVHIFAGRPLGPMLSGGSPH